LVWSPSELLHAIPADQLALELLKIIDVVTKDAAGIVFPQNDLILASEDLHGVPVFDVHGPKKLLRENNPSQFIYRANDTGRFH
jgi:hypothetical protein